MVAYEKNINLIKIVKIDRGNLRKKFAICKNLQKSLDAQNSQTFLIFATETDSRNFYHRNRKPLDTDNFWFPHECSRKKYNLECHKMVWWQYE